MNRLFKERGWIIFNQPSQSPVTNVHDACIFPMMSKAVSERQALEYGSVLLKGEQLYKTVKSVWEDDRHRVAMARAFAGHHQIVCSILHHEGDNQYLSERGGLSFRIRKMFVADAEGVGVVPVTLAPTTEGETTQGQFLNERAIRRLKYVEPEIGELDKAKLNGQMVFVLDELMDKSKMTEQMKTLWEDLVYMANTESETEEDCEVHSAGSSTVSANECSASETESEDDDTVVEATFA